MFGGEPVLAASHPNSVCKDTRFFNSDMEFPFFIYSHAAILDFAKSVKQNPKGNDVAKVQIIFLFVTVL